MSVSQPSLRVRGAHIRRRHFVEKVFGLVCLAATLVGVVLLILLLSSIWSSGARYLNMEFLTSFPSRFAEKAGIKAALFGSLWVMALTGLISLPVGIASAIYLEDYSRKGRLATVIEINISNLAGVPSIVFGILGAAVFVTMMHLGQSVIAGALTMSLLILPTIIIASREAIRAVPNSIRLAAYALGATRWQTVWCHVLPSGTPGILTGVILALSRAIGETAPLIMVGALGYIAAVPKGPNDSFTVLPIQIYLWAGMPKADFHDLAAAGIIVLLAVLLTMNAAAVIIRQRFQRYRL